jgi:hypothetical protein
MNSLISTYEIICRNLFKSDIKVRDQYFKEYFLDSILSKHPYKLLTTKHDRSSTIDEYIQNDTMPEYCFIDLTNDKKFFVDAYHQPAWLGSYPHQYINPMIKQKLLLYQKYDSSRRLFIAITVGDGRISGTPIECFLVPVRFLKHEQKLFRKLLQYFAIQNVDISFEEYSSPLSSHDLWNRFDWRNSNALSIDVL